MGVLSWILATTAVLVVDIAVAAVAPALPFAPIAGFGAAFAMVAGAVLLVGALAPAASPKGAIALIAPLGVIVAVGWWSPRGMVGALAVVGALLTGGSLVGGIVGAGVKHPGHLLVVAWVSSLADLYSVLSPHGVSAHVIRSQAALSLAALSWPIPGTPDISPVLGVGDVMLSTVYLVVARRHRMGIARMVIALTVGYAATFVALLVCQRALPVLPFLAGAVLLIVPGARKLQAKDRRTAFIGMGIMTILFAAAWCTR